METTERIVEAYVRYVKGWATIPNIKCGDQKEIDLFAIDPASGERFHIETTVSILTELSGADHRRVRRRRPQGEGQGGARAANTRLLPEGEIRSGRCEIDPHEILQRQSVPEDYRNLGVGSGGERSSRSSRYRVVGTSAQLMREIAELGRNKRTYFGDDTLRTLTLFAKALYTAPKQESIRENPEYSGQNSTRSGTHVEDVANGH